MIRSALTGILVSLAEAVAAGNFSMEQPVDCTLGTDCFIQQYVDRDPDSGARDFTCGPLSYDGHTGTDFALHDLQAMEQGVNVLAAADGLVLGVRDGEADAGSAHATPGRDCGNGVVLDHGEGWITQYCHLRKGTVSVRQGQRVTSGAPLGLVGLSGRTEFPHVHISVRHHDIVVDPFAPETQETCGVDDAVTLWAKPITYRPGDIIALGLSDAVPSFDAVKEGSLPDLSPEQTTEALVLYAHMFGVRSGDKLAVELNGPSGAIVSQVLELDRTQARSFRALGRRRPDTGWPKGTYTGSAKLKRGPELIAHKRLEFEID